MKSDQMWQAYKILNQTIGDKIDAWAFGVEADYLAELVLMGQIAFSLLSRMTLSSFSLGNGSFPTAYKSKAELVAVFCPINTSSAK